VVVQASIPPHPVLLPLGNGGEGTVFSEIAFFIHVKQMLPEPVPFPFLMGKGKGGGDNSRGMLPKSQAFF
jgi:hypothetical protein